MKYAVIKKESGQNVIANSSISITKTTVCKVNDEFKADENVILFNTVSEANGYIGRSKHVDSMQKIEQEPDQKDESDISDTTVDDYLNRNARTVIKAIDRDKLNKASIEKLLNAEKENKNRQYVIKNMEKIL